MMTNFKMPGTMTLTTVDKTLRALTLNLYIDRILQGKTFYFPFLNTPEPTEGWKKRQYLRSLSYCCGELYKCKTNSSGR